MTAHPRPLIVIAMLPPDVFALADGLRRVHFPPESNRLPAHLTLFHALPPSCESELRSLLADLGKEFAPVPARLTGVISLGRGTALGVDSPDLLRLRDIIANRFAGNLTAQDSHRPRLHITVQNKVTATEARDLQAELAAKVMPRSFEFPGLALHFYDGGPWQAAGNWRFRVGRKRR